MAGAWQRKEGKNPEGGLNAKGRASYNSETGGNLKAPVKSGYPMAAANEEFFVRFKYWLVVGGIITLKACGITIKLSDWELLNPKDLAASFCPLLTAKIPALTFSAINAEVYKERANTNAKNSGINLTPPK